MPAPAWFAAGFDEELTAWLDAALDARGESRTGPLEEHRRWGIGLVARVPTDAGQRWVKAVPDLFAVEGPLTAWLAARFPGDVPSVVALDAERGFTLYEHVDGPLLRNDESVAVVGRAGDTLARLHRGASADSVDELLALGAADRRLGALPEAYVVAVEAAEAEGLIDGGLARRCREAANRLPDLIAEIAAGPVPEGLVHGDFHHRNVLLSGPDAHHPVVIDWTDGCIAHPWFDLPVWREDLRATSIDTEVVARYLDAWSDVVDGPEAARLLEVTHTAGAAWHAWSYRRLLAGLSEEHRSDLGTIGAEWCEAFLNRSGRLLPRASSA